MCNEQSQRVTSVGRMARQASQMSMESMEDCWSENDVRPARTCWKMVMPSARQQSPDSSTAHDGASDVSLQSCNSTETLKQWTMRYPVTVCCQPACSSRRHRRRRKRRRRRDDDDEDSGDESEGETEVDVMYTDCNGELKCCRQPVCCPRKPCTLV